jgi:glutathione S-transferase
MEAKVLELWQTEWCPASRRVRQRVTELGLDCLMHQVPVAQDQRDELERIAGVRTIPVLRSLEGRLISGAEEICAYLEQSFCADARAVAEHRAKAAHALKRLVEEETKGAG